MPTEDKDARPQKILRILIVVIALGAVLFAILATKLLLPLRLLIAATDLVAAGFLWLALRQQSGGKKSP